MEPREPKRAIATTGAAAEPRLPVEGIGVIGGSGLAWRRPRTRPMVDDGVARPRCTVGVVERPFVPVSGAAA